MTYAKYGQFNNIKEIQILKRVNEFHQHAIMRCENYHCRMNSKSSCPVVETQCAVCPLLQKYSLIIS